mgnify:CR=1 FL=1
MYRKDYLRHNPTNAFLKEPLPSDYFNFIARLDLNDPAILALGDFSTFINRFEYSTLFSRDVYYDALTGRSCKEVQKRLFTAPYYCCGRL